MPIPETQLDTWSHQGSITQSSTTYNTIKTALEASTVPYADKNVSVFLQGSYGNDTNIYAESDVDIVIRLRSNFYHDLESLPDDQKAVFRTAHSDGTYPWADFMKDVLAHLVKTYGDAVKPGDKAILILPGGGRRRTDVIVATEFRRYHRFESLTNESHDTGICFYRSTGERIANYPEQHRANCIAKHQATDGWYKPMVRILKNMRGKLIADGLLEAGTAPSYYLEGLLYNVPNDKFGTNYGDSFVNCINWMLNADRSTFVCANRQYYLLRESSPVTWRDAQCTQFLNAAGGLWKNWQ